jgi:hypothetical protein
VDVPINDDNASIPEQVKRPNPWMMMMMMMMIWCEVIQVAQRMNLWLGPV